MKSMRRSFMRITPIFALVLFLCTALPAFAAKSTNTASSITQVATSSAIGVSRCGTHTDYLHIFVGNNNVVCYSGDGYTGASLAPVEDYFSGNNCGWFRIYFKGGSPIKYWPFSSRSAFSFATDIGGRVLITQVKIQGQNCSGHIPK